MLYQIASCHSGILNDSRFDKRIHGEGQIAKQINDLIALAKSKYFKNKKHQHLMLAYIKLIKMDIFNYFKKTKMGLQKPIPN